MNRNLLRKLISSWLDDTISQDDMAQLEALLQEDAHARQFFLDHMDVHSELSNVGAADCGFENLNQSDNPILAEIESAGSDYGSLSRQNPSWSKWPIAIAATLLLAFGLWNILEVSTNSPLPDQQQAADSDADILPSILGSIEPTTKDTMWYIEGARESTASDSIIADDVLRVTSGKLTLNYNNGIEIVLHSPAAYEIISGMKARMIVGRLTAVVSEEGKGFSVITPQATVIDLGTKFGVEVDKDGTTDVVVFKGLVDLDYHNDRSEPKNDRRLSMGEAVRLEAIGTTSRIVSIDQRHYSAEEAASTEKSVVISSVHDNVERDAGVMNYYEIVNHGFQEDSLAYVDRISHQWNGIDASGIPPYLLGGDYVKTFNSDKYNRNIEVTLTVDTPCMLYVLFDDRLPIPKWLKEGFVSTGDSIGMDTGMFFSNGEWHNRRSTGVGPGESVEDTLSVWVNEIKSPGLVFLGATEAKSVSNMYGIVATPLDQSSIAQ